MGRFIGSIRRLRAKICKQQERQNQEGTDTNGPAETVSSEQIDDHGWEDYIAEGRASGNEPECGAALLQKPCRYLKRRINSLKLRPVERRSIHLKTRA